MNLSKAFRFMNTMAIVLFATTASASELFNMEVITYATYIWNALAIIILAILLIVLEVANKNYSRHHTRVMLVSWPLVQIGSLFMLGWSFLIIIAVMKEFFFK